MIFVEYWMSAIKQAAIELDGEKVKVLTAQLANAVAHHPQFDHEGFCLALQSALNEYDSVQVDSLCNQLISALNSDDNEHVLASVHVYLRNLQRKRKFGLMLQMADVALQCGEYRPKVKLLYAQALIEEKRLIAAIDVLTEIEAHCVDKNLAHEGAEARGLLGRAWKQIYIDAFAAGHVGAPQKTALKNAVRFYRNEFDRDRDDRLWHGINAVALTQRAERDGVELSPEIGDSDGTVLQYILNSIDQRIGKSSQSANNDIDCDLDMWGQATAAEAFLAKGEFTEALRWIGLYVDSEHVTEANSDAFEIASTLRQFEEVWQLSDDTPDQNRILEILRAALLRREGGAVSIADPAEESAAISHILKDSTYEKVLGADRYNNLRWFQTGLNRAQCVCRIEDEFGTGVGTGFLVPIEALGISHTQEWVVLTNSHVVSNDPSEQSGKPAALTPEAARIRFEAVAGSNSLFSVANILAWSPRNELDFSVLAINELQHVPEPYRIAKHLPLKDANQRIYVIGHPRGGGLSFSLYDNLLIDHEVPKLHYRSPTEGGSSGSPVFNQAWELIGLHHAGSTDMPRLNGQSGHYPANEGISIQSIISYIQKT